MKYLWLLCFLLGCSGYRFTQQDNPLSQYGIESLSVPMFYNFSNQPHVSGDFTRETYRLLTTFSGLKLVSGYSESTDAVLIGIIKSPEKIIQTLQATNLVDAKRVAEKSIGKTTSYGQRGTFYVPGGTTIQLYLQVIVIKKPSEQELALLKSGIGEQVGKSSRVIFNELIPLTTGVTREYLDNEGTQVVGTQNQGILRRGTRELASQAAIAIRDTIFYAF